MLEQKITKLPHNLSLNAYQYVWKYFKFVADEKNDAFSLVFIPPVMNKLLYVWSIKRFYVDFYFDYTLLTKKNARTSLIDNCKRQSFIV